jgi:hypothetical protein
MDTIQSKWEGENDIVDPDVEWGWFIDIPLILTPNHIQHSPKILINAPPTIYESEHDSNADTDTATDDQWTTISWMIVISLLVFW